MRPDLRRQRQPCHPRRIRCYNASDLDSEAPAALRRSLGLLDPWIGRFIQPDSIVPNPANPQALNRYSYVYNNPMRYTDPTGHCQVDVKLVRYHPPGEFYPDFKGTNVVEVDLPKLPPIPYFFHPKFELQQTPTQGHHAVLVLHDPISGLYYSYEGDRRTSSWLEFGTLTAAHEITGDRSDLRSRTEVSEDGTSCNLRRRRLNHLEDLINAANVPYEPLGPNSNSVIATYLVNEFDVPKDELGDHLPPVGPADVVPGFDEPLLSPNPDENVDWSVGPEYFEPRDGRYFAGLSR